MSLVGRANHVASNRLGPVARALSRVHGRLYAKGRGGWMERYFGAPLFSLTVTGRTSGEPRTVMLIQTRRGDDLVVGGSNGGNHATPNWYSNLVAAGRAEVQVGDERWPVTFREVEGDEREECWALLVATYPDFETYQGLTERRIPVAVLERA